MVREPRVTWEAITLRLHNPFRVSYGSSETREAYWLRLADDEGWGEGTIPPYYGVDPAAMQQWWEKAAAREEPFPDEPEAIAGWVGDDGPAPARTALDLALHDRIGRQRGVPLYELLGVRRPAAMATAITVSIDEPEAMAEEARRLARYPILKIKLGGDGDVERVAAVRAARPHARLYIDANAAWAPEAAVRHLEALAPYSLELVEQPVARDDFAGMGYVQARLDVPVVADESVQSLADVERLAEAGVGAINLKLMKLGGLAATLLILRYAREAGMRIMLGCMVETSLGVTAMAHLSGEADWLDLDAPLLIANDPFSGVEYDDEAKVHLPGRPGIGVVKKEDSE
ncbi:MAG: dipeptide epimerase [Anaerolineae bacterium]|nr:dipeptide epimerase [Anaerolineae bacterium]